MVEVHTLKKLNWPRKCDACGFKYKINHAFEVYQAEMHDGINQGVKDTQENKHPYTLFYLRAIKFN